MPSLSPTPSTVKPDVYRTKAIITRKRRAQSDARLTAQFAERQRAFQAKLDAIAAAQDYEDDILDREDWARGNW